VRQNVTDAEIRATIPLPSVPTALIIPSGILNLPSSLSITQNKAVITLGTLADVSAGIGCDLLSYDATLYV
jgi:hypothetical protein